MPFFEDTAAPGQISAIPDPVEREAPDMLTTLGAAVRRENLIGSMVSSPGAFEPVDPFDPTHDPFAMVKGTKYEPFIYHFATSGNEKKTRLIMERIDQNQEDDAILAESGPAGFATGLMAGVFDVTSLLPGGALVQGARRGVAVAKSARNVGAAAGASVAVQEAGLHATQELRTAEESAFNIAGGVLLGGLLGGAAGTLTKAEFNSLGKLVEREMQVPPEGTPDPYMPGSVGAAATSDGVDNSLKGSFNVDKMVSFQDPLIRLQTSSSPAAQRHIQELAETPLVLQKNVEGSPTAPEGLATGAPGAVETRIKMWDAPLSESLQELDRLFLQYRGRIVAPGSLKARASLMRTTVSDLVGTTERMTYPEFKEAVGRAMRTGDTSDVPEVAAAAKAFREKLYDPLKDEAISAKLLDEDIDVTTADSYLNRVYNKERIIQERGRFKAAIGRWLGETETSNEKVTQKLGSLVDAHKIKDGNVRKLEKKIERRSASAAKTDARRDELSRLNRFAFARSSKMSEPLDQVRAKIEGIGDQIQDQLDAIGELSSVIRAERESIPGLVELEAQMQKLSRGISGINKQADLVDVVEAADEINAGMQALKDGIAPVLREMGAESRALRKGQEALKTAEKARRELGQQIRPLRSELMRLRKELRARKKTAGANARGGAVFETKIRNRGNAVADQVSGRNAELDKLEADLKARRAEREDLQKQIEEQVLEYQGKSKSQAESAVKSRTKAEEGRDPDKGRLRTADKSVLKSARTILKRRGKDADEIEELADEIIDRILGTPEGRLPYDAAGGGSTGASAPSSSLRGPLKARVFNIPDKLIEEFLESDIEFLSRSYKRTLSADVELTKRFGDVELTPQMKEIVDDFNRLIEAAPDAKERVKLEKQKSAAIRDLGAIRDRLRGTYGIPSDPSSVIVRAGRVARSINFLRLLGGMTVSAIPDIARPMMVHGFNRVFGNGFVPMVSNMKQFKLAANEVKMAGTALDMVLDSRTMAIADVMDDFGRHSKFERAVQGLSSKFGVISLMAPWNAAMKQFTGVITMTRILDAAEAVKAGKASAKEIENLAQSGIDPAMAQRIAEQFSSAGSKEDGVSFANTAEWGDRSAVEAFRAAVVRDVDRTIVTPGQDRPLWMSGELGKLVGQFRSFAIASTQRTMLAGLQQRDLATLNGAAMMMGLGALTYYLKQGLGGRPVSDDPKIWAVEAFDRSGLAGWLMEANNMTEKATRGQVGLSFFTGRPVSRFASRNVTGAMIGPTAGTIQDMFQISGATFMQDFKESDVRAMRRLIPLQNLFYTRKLFDEAEANIADVIGAEN